MKKHKSFISRLENYVEETIRDTLGSHALVDAVLEDHLALKGLIRDLKDPEVSDAKKKTSFLVFKTLLKSHSDAEERVLYALCSRYPEVKLKIEEGIVEHRVAEIFLGTIPSSPERGNAPHWRAQLQVLGEIVEHHLKEEERDLLPIARKRISVADEDLGAAVFRRRRRAGMRRSRQGILQHA